MLSPAFPHLSIPSVPNSVYNAMKSEGNEIKTITLQQQVYSLALKRGERYYIRGMPKPVKIIEEHKQKVIGTLKFSER